MIIKSIRWRLQLWLAFLLICLLSGFGAAVWQLNRINQLRQIDEELERRVAALSAAVRGGPRPDFGPGHPPFDGLPRGPGGPGGPGRMDGPGGTGGPGDSGLTNGRGRGGPEEEGPPPPGSGRFEGPRPGGSPPDLRFRTRELRLAPGVANLFDETRTNDFYYAVWSRDRSLIRSSTNAPANVPIPGRVAGDTLTQTRMRDALREAFHYTELGDCVLAGRDISADLMAEGRFRFWLLGAGATVLALGLGGGWWLTTRAIRPVEDISAAAGRISAGNLSERIVGADADNELGRLAAVLNSTFARLEAAFAQQKQFTADASHELRTPLAVIISEAQSVLARERSAAEYRETVETCLEAAQQIRRLTESLLELARLDAGQEPAGAGPVDLAEIARAAVERIRPLARQRGLGLECDLAPASVSGRAERLEQVVTNLLSNAIHYNKPNGEIRVFTRCEDGTALLGVSDSGPGIAEEDLPHIFERFYRADKSRSGAEGRSGLGLAICKAIVDAHGGSIEVASRPGAGATFTLRLREKG